MKKKMFRKALVFGVMLLFFGMSVISSTSGINAEKYDDVNRRTTFNNCIFEDTIYVDDDNTAGPWDGTQEHPYQYIQDGIDAASNGDTVYVFNGYYRENIEIKSKSIDLIGEDRENTIIAGDNSACTVIIGYSNDTKIDSFTVKNQPDDFQIYNGIHAYACNHITITNIIATQEGCRWSIWIGHVDNSLVSDNILGNKSKGIKVKFSDNNVISRNIIRNNDEEMASIYLEGSHMNTITENIISANDNPGIGLVSSTKNTIVDNDIRDNTYGIYLASNSCNNKITRNNLVDNEIHDGYFKNSRRNKWSRNYWGPTANNGLFKIIHGCSYTEYGAYYRSRIWFDLFPSSEPYPIP